MRLVLNNFQDLYQKNTKNLFLGEWCHADQKLNLNDNKIIQKYHWEDKNKLSKDYKYLDSLILTIHKQLAQKLNKIHNTSLQDEYWNIVLSPWVEFFVTSLFDKWESVKIAHDNFSITDVSIYDYKQKKIPADYYEFLCLFNNEEWNHSIFGEIIKFIGKPECKINRIEKKEISFSKNATKPKFYKVFLDIVFSKIQKKNKILFLDHYFGKINYLKICLKLIQFPRIFHEFYKKINFPQPDSINRNKLKLDLDNNEFEKFLSKTIFLNIPVCFLEGYEIMHQKVLEIKLDTDVIITGNRDFVSDLARFWAAHQATKNKKIILNEHGGGIPYKYMHYSITNETFNDQIIWVKNKIFDRRKKINQKQLTPGRLINFSNLKSKNKIDIKNKFISLITIESYLFAKQCVALPSSLILKDFAQKDNLLKLLKNQNIEFKIKPFKDRGWNLSKKFRDNFGKNVITNLSTKDLIKKSKLMICGYPETPLMESMVSGTPTILLFLKDYWEFEDDYQDLIKTLKKNKILFSSSDEAFEHISKVYSNPYEWWNDKEVVRARERFHLDCGGVSSNWLKEWSNYLKEKTKDEL